MRHRKIETDLNWVRQFLEILKQYIETNHLIPISQYYAGIGCREHKIAAGMMENVRATAEQIARFLQSRDMILRSGGASGLDSYFEQALLLTHSKDEKSAKDIYYAIDTDKITDETAHKMLFGITAYFHPTQAKLLQQEIQYITPLARNLFQIIGIEPFQDTGCITLMQQLKANGSVDINKLELDIRPVRFVLCYTEDGCENHQGRTRQTGGTGQTISYADYFGIPIINLKNLDIMNRINQQLI